MDDTTSPPNSPETLAARSNDALRALSDRAHESLAAQRTRINNLEGQLSERLDSIAEALAKHISEREKQLEVCAAQLESDGEEFNTRTIQIDSREIELHRREYDLTNHSKKLDEREREIGRREEQCKDRESELSGREAQLTEREEELAAANQQLVLVDEQELPADGQARQQHEQGPYAELQAERDELLKKVANLEKELSTARESTHHDHDGLKESLVHLENGFNEKEAILRADVANLQAERDELREKFDIALSDVQRLRETVSELEQEPARRPPNERDESGELVDLRAERDALAEQVATLKSRAAQTPSADSDQHLADLQRRFELAVEDVRELKTENAKLKHKLAETHPDGATGLDIAQDWETQKRRLLATLENESEAVDSQQRQQRASIESTIQITDEVVAEKDREIAELNERIANSREDVPDNDDTSLATEAVDADEVVQQQRARLAQLEQEMQEKLRATELELSVQRAKVAREQAELAEWRTELETLRESLHSSPGGSGGDGAPRRRWLAKLGLGGDDE